MEAQKTGLLWMLKANLTPEILEKLKVSHRYLNPKDETVFETFIELNDKIGVPYGDINKVTSILEQPLDIKDCTISPKFAKKKVSKLELRDYQETVMTDIEEFIYKGAGTSFNLSGEPGSQESHSCWQISSLSLALRP